MSHLLISKLVILNMEALHSAALQTDVSVITHLVPTKVFMGYTEEGDINEVMAKHTLTLRGHERPVVIMDDGTVVWDDYGYNKATKEDVRQLFTRYNLIDAVHQAREEFGSEAIFTEPTMNENGCVELDIILEA